MRRIIGIPDHKHLTATERRAITALLDHPTGQTYAVGRKRYRLDPTGEGWTVTITDPDGRRYRCTFQVG